MGSALPLHRQQTPSVNRVASILRSLRDCRGRDRSVASYPLVRFHSPSEFDQPAPPRFASRRQRRGSFHGVLFPSTSSARGVHWFRVCLTRYVPLSGFRNLLAAYSSSNLVGLFRPTDVPGITPSRAFSSPRAVSPHRRSMPSCRSFLPSASPRYPVDGGAHHVRPRFERTRPRGRLQGFALVSSSFVVSWLLPHVASRCSPGLCPL